MPEPRDRKPAPFPGMRGPGGRPGFGGGHGAMFGPKVKAKDVRGTLRRLGAYLSRERRPLLAVGLVTIINIAAGLVSPLLIGRAIDRYILPGDFAGLFRLAGWMTVVYLGGGLSAWLQSYLMVDVAQNTVQTMRNDLFAHLQRLPLRFFDRHPHGELMSRVTNDLDNVSNALNTSVAQLFASAITILGTLGLMLSLSPLLTFFSVLIVPLMLLTTGAIAGKTRTAFAAHQARLGQLNGIVEETITGQRAVKVFTHEAQSLAKFDRTNTQLRDIGIRAQLYSGLIPPLMNVLNNLSFAIVAGIGGWLVVRGAVTVGVIASFINYTKQFSRPLNEVASQYNLIQSAVAGAERVFQIMDETPEPADRPAAVPLTDVAGAVVFDQVTFGYDPDQPVLQGISLSTAPGQTVALVGPTGAGKTTIVNLLPRFYDIDQGQITIDGQDIRDLKRDSLRATLGIVLQDTHLFSETVRENIRFGRLTATDQEVVEAATLASADGFIRQLPAGYDTVLTEDGGNLSQGQRQLLSIARAILADPAILILDEATSSVDTRTEVHIRAAMLRLMRGRTSFVIAHRLSTISDADQILVIDHGRILEQGTHGSLLAAGGLYAQLYQSQFRRQVS